jgi:DNA-directed RNA polymerase specialized sigma24 family protein
MRFTSRKSEMPTTQWSLIARLRCEDEVDARRALDELCRAYHYPLYCQIRRRGLSHHDAEDALHEFFLKLLRLDTFVITDSEKGRLRTFLIVALRRFLASWQKAQYRKQSQEISQEAIAAIADSGQRFELDESAHHESPDQLYDRQWVQELMNLVLARLKDRYAAKGRSALFEALRPVLLSGGSLTGHDGDDLASSLEIRPGALRTALHRLLEDYREALRQEILRTVESREMARKEYDELVAVFQVR